MDSSTTNIAILLIAAGESKRLGQAKQLVPFKGSTLIEHTLSVCLAADLGAVYVVTGAHQEKISILLKEQPCQLIHNPDFRAGMGTSIARGIQMMDTQSLEGVIIVLVDQLHLTTDLLRSLVLAYQSNNQSIILSQYKVGQGPPSFFHKQHFDALTKLSGDQGAKPIIKQFKDQVGYIDFELGDIDLDTPEDLERLEG